MDGSRTQARVSESEIEAYYRSHRRHGPRAKPAAIHHGRRHPSRDNIPPVQIEHGPRDHHEHLRPRIDTLESGAIRIAFVRKDDEDGSTKILTTGWAAPSSYRRRERRREGRQRVRAPDQRGRLSIYASSRLHCEWFRPQPPSTLAAAISCRPRRRVQTSPSKTSRQACLPPRSRLWMSSSGGLTRRWRRRPLKLHSDPNRHGASRRRSFVRYAAEGSGNDTAKFVSFFSDEG
jgi:hypothetical protein